MFGPLFFSKSTIITNRGILKEKLSLKTNRLKESEFDFW
jgi:hypothetical protein